MRLGNEHVLRQNVIHKICSICFTDTHWPLPRSIGPCIHSMDRHRSVRSHANKFQKLCAVSNFKKKKMWNTNLMQCMLWFLIWFTAFFNVKWMKWKTYCDQFSSLSAANKDSVAFCSCVVRVEIHFWNLFMVKVIQFTKLIKYASNDRKKFIEIFFTSDVEMSFAEMVFEYYFIFVGGTRILNSALKWTYAESINQLW